MKRSCMCGCWLWCFAWFLAMLQNRVASFTTQLHHVDCHSATRHLDKSRCKVLQMDEPIVSSSFSSSQLWLSSQNILFDDSNLPSVPLVLVLALTIGFAAQLWINRLTEGD